MTIIRSNFHYPDGERAEVHVGATARPIGLVFVSVSLLEEPSVRTAHFSPAQARTIAEVLLQEAESAERELAAVNINNRTEN